jgi:hypothetical protein
MKWIKKEREVCRNCKANIKIEEERKKKEWCP